MISNYAMSVNNQTRTVGIYKITCVPNGKIYIGSSVDVRNRWWNHKSQLKHQKHTNQHLQRAYDKYGKEAFLWEVIEECSKEQLRLREQHYLDTLQPFYKNNIGFNATIDSTAPTRGIKWSKERRAKQEKTNNNKSKPKYRCIVIDTKEVIRIPQREIQTKWNIHPHTFLSNDTFISKHGLANFPEREVDGKIYTDEEAAQYLIDRISKRNTGRSESQKGRIVSEKRKQIARHEGLARWHQYRILYSFIVLITSLRMLPGSLFLFLLQGLRLQLPSIGSEGKHQ